MAPTATELPIFRTEEIRAKLMAIYRLNRLGFGRIDQRELVLRDTLYRDMLGERPQGPTQRQPPPEAPAGDLQPATPRRSDPEHPPLGAPLSPCEQLQLGED